MHKNIKKINLRSQNLNAIGVEDSFFLFRLKESSFVREINYISKSWVQKINRLKH